MAERQARPKLLVVIGTLDHMGGAERQALYLVEHLRGLERCDVEVLSFEEGATLRGPLRELGVNVHVTPYYFRWPRARRARTLTQLASALRLSVRPDALLPFVGIHSKTMAMVWPYSGARFCWWNQQDEGRDLGGTRTEKNMLGRVSCITSNSVAGRDFLSKTYGLPYDSILVYNNGTPLPDLAGIRNDWAGRNGLAGRPIVSMVANITSFKDHATLLEAWAIVRRSMPPSEPPLLVLAGNLKETGTVTKLKLQAFDLGLSSSDVMFLGAVSDVTDVVAGSDLLVHSSLTEGCPNAVCEAMALSKAVVATDIPGCRQALGTGGGEWLSEPRNAKAMADRIIRLLRDPSLREKVGAANRARIQAEFTIEGMNRFFQERIEHGLGVSLR